MEGTPSQEQVTPVDTPKPEPGPARVLLCVVGLSPQIVTEVLYADAVGQNELSERWVPDVVHLVSTGRGARLLTGTLLDPSSTLLSTFCEAHDVPAALNAQVHVLEDENGGALEDIVTPEHNAAAADYICNLVQRLCSEPDTQLHVSVAGGRKTMSLFAAYALSFFGRSRDRLSHVLVSEPFEQLPGFFYPDQPQQQLADKEGAVATAAHARIWLARVPYVRLSRAHPAQLLSAGQVSYSGYCELFEGTPSVRVDLARCQLICSQRVRVTLTPAQTTLYAYYAWRLQRGDPDVSSGDVLRDIEVLRRIYRITLSDEANPSGISAKLDKTPLFNYDTARADIITSLRKVFGSHCAAAETYSPMRRANGTWGLPLGLRAENVELTPQEFPPLLAG